MTFETVTRNFKHFFVFLSAAKYKGTERQCCVDGMKDNIMGFTCQRRTEYITDGDKCVKAFLHCCTEMADQKKEAKDEQLHLARSKNPHIYILCGNTHTCRHTHTLSQTHIHTYPPTKMHTQNICTIHTHMHIYIYTYIHPSIHLSIHTYIHTYVHTVRSINIWTLTQFSSFWLCTPPQWI